ncbi:MAG: hypothetical protein, partial [Olavius algarvensis Gamma 1 endosymbiont]
PAPITWIWPSPWMTPDWRSWSSIPRRPKNLPARCKRAARPMPSMPRS